MDIFIKGKQNFKVFYYFPKVIKQISVLQFQMIRLLFDLLLTHFCTVIGQNGAFYLISLLLPALSFGHIPGVDLAKNRTCV